MLTKVFGSAVFGVDATTITVEVNIDKGIGYHLVGLPDNAIKRKLLPHCRSLKKHRLRTSREKDNHQDRAGRFAQRRFRLRFNTSHWYFRSIRSDKIQGNR